MRCSGVKCSEVTKNDNHESSAHVNITCVKNITNINKVKAELCGVTLEILIDTGSTVNAISSSLVDAMGKDLDPLTCNDYKSCTLADSSRAVFKGKVTLDIIFGDLKTDITFYVLPATYDYAIIGCAFLRKYGANINFEKNCVEFNGATINFLSDNGAISDIEEDDEVLRYINMPKEFDEDYIMEELEGDKMTRVLLQDNNNMNSTQKTEFLSMLHERREVFAECLAELGCCKTTTCEIDLKSGTEPIYIRPYKNAWSKRDAMLEQCNEWLEAGIIRINKRPKFNFPAVMVPKKNSTKQRLCINFQALNDQVVPERHPAMTIEQFLCDFGAMQGRIFSVLDLGSAYLQIPLSESAQEYCTFTVGHKSYSFTRVPFGFVNSGHIFGRALSEVLDDLLHKTVEHFVDDLVIISPSIEQHQKDVAEVLDRLHNAGFTIEPRKSHFCKPSVEYLGYVLESNSVKVNHKNISKVLKYPTPQKKKDVQTFCGMCVYYRKYIPKYSIIMAPLYALTKKDVEFHWSSQCEAAFQEMKERLTSAPILAPPNLASDEPLHVTIDGSSHGSAWVIEQKSLDPVTNTMKMRTVCYGSKTISKAESKYHSTDLELLALETCLKANRIMLLSKPFHVYTDNRSLVYLLRKDLDQVKGTTARRLLTCKQYPFTIDHVKGKFNHADALSRFPGENEPEQNIVNDDGPYVFHTVCTENLLQAQTENIGITIEQIRDAQESDNFVKEMVQCIKNNGCDNLKIEQKAVDYMLDEGILYNVRQMRNQLKPSIRLYVPKDLVPKVLHSAHSHVLSGHLGIQNTLARIHQKFYWPNMPTDVALYVKACKKCAETKRGHYAKAPLVPLPVPEGPFKVLHIDTMKLHTPSCGYSYVLTIVDAFSKLLITKALKNKSAIAISKAIFECVIQRYGCVVRELVVISDNAKELTMSYTKALYKLLGVTNIKITPFSPSSNGQAEIYNRKILHVLKSYTANNPRTWSQNLPLVTMALNSCRNATGFSAYELMHGIGVLDVMDLNIESSPDTASKTEEQAHQFWCAELEKVRKLAKYRLETDKVVQKEQYDKHAAERHFAQGDLVYIQNTQLDLEGDTKLKKSFIGPYEVMEYKTPVNITLKDVSTGDALPRSIHVNKVKMYLPAADVKRGKDGRVLHNDSLPDFSYGCVSSSGETADNSDGESDDKSSVHGEAEEDVQSSTPPDVSDDDASSVVDDPEDSTPEQPSDIIRESSPETTNSNATENTENRSETDDEQFFECNDEQYFEVDKITRARSGKDCDEYYVSYKGYPKTYNQWIKATDMTSKLLERAESLKLPRAKPRLSLIKT